MTDEEGLWQQDLKDGCNDPRLTTGTVQEKVYPLDVFKDRYSGGVGVGSTDICIVSEREKEKDMSNQYRNKDVLGNK